MHTSQTCSLFKYENNIRHFDNKIIDFSVLRKTTVVYCILSKPCTIIYDIRWI